MAGLHIRFTLLPAALYLKKTVATEKGALNRHKGLASDRGPIFMESFLPNGIRGLGKN